MIRAFENEKRIATAVALKDGGILQVYPTKEKVLNEETWKATWTREGVTFKHEDKQTAQETGRLSGAEKTARNRIKYYCSLGNLSDTPMQALVRKIYNQEGIPDSLRSTMRHYTHTSYLYGNSLRLDPGIYVLLPENGHIVPVYFNRKTGAVAFENKDEANEPTDGLKFYRKEGCRLIPIELNNDVQRPGQKAVMLCQGILRYRIHSYSVLKQLRDAGFFIYTYNARGHPSLEEAKEMQRLIPNLEGILWDIYSETAYFFDPNAKNYYLTASMNFKKWIEQHK
jgi:hypothetical protein